MRQYDDKLMSSAIKVALMAMGEDSKRQGLQGTPDRVARAWREMLAGCWEDPAQVLKTSSGEDGFTGTGYDGMVVLAGYSFTSVCEHHLLPFIGLADVGYLPALGEQATVVGLSKLGRLVDVFARRLQVQERLTTQVAQALQEHLQPRGVGVRMRAVHLCMACRGVRKPGTMTTQVVLGAMRDQPQVRAEFWQNCEALARVPV